MILVSRTSTRPTRLLLLAPLWLLVPLASLQQQQQQQTHLSPIDWTADQAYSPPSAPPVQPIAPPSVASDDSDSPPASFPPTRTLPPPPPPANDSAPCSPDAAPGAEPTAFHLPKFFPVDLRVVDERAMAADLVAHRAYDRQHQIAERAAHRLQPRQVVVVGPTTYPGTDTIYATKTVFVNGPQQSPDSHPAIAGAAVTVIVNPAFATPAVYGNGPGRGPNTTPNGNPNVVVATVTVLSSANKVVWDEFRRSGWPTALVMNFVVCLCISIGVGVVHLGGL